MTAPATSRDLLPAHGTLSPEALYGFRVACACMATWGTQIANTTAMPEMRQRGQLLHHAAMSLSNTIGAGQIPAAPASVIPSGFAE